MKPIKRAISKLTVSELYDCFRLNKLPNVAIDTEIDQEKQSTFIELILFNYPTKSLIVQQHIEEGSNRTLFYLARGSEKIEIMIDYIEKNLQGNSLSHMFKSKEEEQSFWSYSFMVEYISSDLTPDEVDYIVNCSEIY